MGKKSTTPQKPKNRALDVPAEANRDKHINYPETPEENLLPDQETRDERNPVQKIFLKKKKNTIKDPIGTHAPGEQDLPDNPRNLPTENTSMRANEVKAKKSS